MSNNKLSDIQSKLTALEREKTMSEGRVSELVNRRDEYLKTLAEEHNIKTPQELTAALETLDTDIDILEEEVNTLIESLPAAVQNRINGTTSTNSQSVNSSAYIT